MQENHFQAIFCLYFFYLYINLTICPAFRVQISFIMLTMVPFFASFLTFQDGFLFCPNYIHSLLKEQDAVYRSDRMLVYTRVMLKTNIGVSRKALSQSWSAANSIFIYFRALPPIHLYTLHAHKATEKYHQERSRRLSPYSVITLNLH